MKGDFSRNSFDKNKHYSSVRMQQGRVQLDSDWNEQMDIWDHLIQTETNNFIGGSGVPASNEGYVIQAASTADNLTIGPGQYYVNGVLVENETEIAFTEQTRFSSKDLPVSNGLYLAYLDVWQRNITAAEDSSIREIALQGLDTTTRFKDQGQVKLLALEEDGIAEINCNTVFGDNTSAPQSAKNNANLWNELIHPVNPGMLTANANNTVNLSNQLYRVEIHDSGTQDQATFKWSRDNGAVVVTIEKIENNMITIAPSLSGIAFEAEQWVELSNETRTLRNQPGVFVQLLKVEGNELTVIAWPTAIDTSKFLGGTLRQWNTATGSLLPNVTEEFFSIAMIQREFGKIKINLDSVQKPNPISTGLFVELKKVSSDENSFFSQITSVDDENNLIIINDLAEISDTTIDALSLIRIVGSGTTIIEETDFIPLENGLEIKFEVGNYKTGDYWLIETRSANSDINWPTDNLENRLPQPPVGIQHYYERLALVRKSDTGWDVIEDCRSIFAPFNTITADKTTVKSVMHFDEAGNVGIGTNDPAAKLDVHGDVAFRNAALIAEGLDVGESLNVGPNKALSYEASVLSLQNIQAIDNTTRVTIETSLGQSLVSLLRGDQVIKIATQVEFEAVFGNGSSVVTIPENTTIVLSPIQGIKVGDISKGAWGGMGDKPENTYNGRPAYVLKNQVILSENVSIIGFNEADTVVIKNKSDVKFKILRKETKPVFNIHLQGWSFDGRGGINNLGGAITTDGAGGAFFLEYCEQCELNCIIVNHRASGFGGGIAGGDLVQNIKAFKVMDCSTTEYGGGVDNCDFSKFEVRNCDADKGGGGFHNCDNAIITVISCTTLIDGGGADNCNNSMISARDCIANHWGGGAYNCNNSVITLINCKGLLKNSAGGGACSCHASEITAFGCTAEFGGGAYLCEGSTILARNCSANDNGGGVHSCDESVITAKHCSAMNGGGAYGSHRCTITVLNCSASKDGGGAHECNSSVITARSCSVGNQGGGAARCHNMVGTGSWIGNGAGISAPNIFSTHATDPARWLGLFTINDAVVYKPTFVEEDI